MSDNIINLPNGGIAIINGGDPLPGCPESWDEARKIETEFNAHLDPDYDDRPRWKFDCGFKLDYDGSLVTISSRFYPPTTHGGSTWDGSVSIMFMGNEIGRKKFDCQSIQELKKQAEEYANGFAEKIKQILTP